jgi:hypothetical protein
VQVTRNGGTGYAAESPNGKFLYYLRSWGTGQTELWRARAEGGEETMIGESVCAQYFTVSNSGIYFFSGWVNPSVQRLRFAARKIETVARLEGRIVYGLSVSPDDHWLLYSKPEGRGSDLMLVENFR